MLSDQWYAVTTTSVLGAKPLGIRRFARDLVLWRDPDGQACCAVDACPHRGAALSRGRVHKGCLECPYHGLRFEAEGACVAVPAHPKSPIPPALHLSTLPVREAHGLVWVFNGQDPKVELPWDAAFEAELKQDGGVFVDLSDEFDVSYLRVMENLTDFHHVAHVHRTTAPVPAEITAFSARREGLNVYVTGTLGNPGERGHMHAGTHIAAPSLAQLHFAGLARFAVCATPIDADNVWLFARYSQTAVSFPGLEGLLTRLLGAFDYRLLQRLQDVPIWRSQRLKDPGDIGRYTLLPADEGIRLYFEIHQELSR
jgi:nitrite reductase/ring-hydroxylating ferredoxin subunit